MGARFAADPSPSPLYHSAPDGTNPERIPSSRDPEAKFGRTFFGTAAGGVVVGTLSGATFAFTGWGLSGQSASAAKAGAYVGGIPGVTVGVSTGAQWALRGTDREPSYFGSLARSLAAGGVGMVVWKQVAGDIAPEHHDARWRRGVAAGFVTQAFLTAVLSHAL